MSLFEKALQIGSKPRKKQKSIHNRDQVSLSGTTHLKSKSRQLADFEQFKMQESKAMKNHQSKTFFNAGSRNTEFAKRGGANSRMVDYMQVNQKTGVKKKRRNIPANAGFYDRETQDVVNHL